MIFYVPIFASCEYGYGTFGLKNGFSRKLKGHTTRAKFDTLARAS